MALHTFLWLAFLPFSAGGVISATDAEVVAALGSDEQCDATGGGDCALHALQVRTERLGGESSYVRRRRFYRSGSCQEYGCDVEYTSEHGCQCNADCVEFGNCCTDFQETCDPNQTMIGPNGGDQSEYIRRRRFYRRGSCQEYGCDIEYTSEHGCQCNAHCVKYGNCCTDYEETCNPTNVAPGGADDAGSETSNQNVFGHPSSSKAYPSYDGFTLMLAEEFDSPIDLDNDPVWTWSDGGLGEGQVRFVREGIKFEHGKMKLVVNHANHENLQSCSHAEVGEIEDKPLTSGEMRTKHNMFRYGRYEARMRAPEVHPGDSSTNGNYVATLFVYRDAKYKHWREIDIELTGDSPQSVTTNVLWAENTDRWRPDIADSSEYQVPDNARSNFHNYAIEWLPDRISWYIDGELIREKKGGTVPISHLPAKILMNLWIFGESAGFGGKEIQNNQYPMYSEYDWFRFYKWNDDGDYPCAGLDTSCLTDDDKYLSSNNPCDGIPQVGTVYDKPACHASCQAL